MRADTRVPSTDAAIGLALEHLRAGRRIRIVNVSDSLWPLVRRGDELELDPSAAFRVGSLVAVERAGRIVVHRVIAEEADRVRLKGDALEREDEPVSRAGVLAVVVTQRFGGSGRTIHHDRAGMRVLAAAAAKTSARSRLPWRLLRRMVRLRGILDGPWF